MKTKIFASLCKIDLVTQAFYVDWIAVNYSLQRTQYLMEESFKQATGLF